jgi:hypothetical protein
MQGPEVRLGVSVVLPGAGVRLRGAAVVSAPWGRMVACCAGGVTGRLPGRGHGVTARWGTFRHVTGSAPVVSRSSSSGSLQTRSRNRAAAITAMPASTEAAA